MNALFFSSMNWKDVIDQILRDFRVSDYQLAQITGITQPTLYRIRRGDTTIHNQNTIKMLEKGMKIKINDSNPENITYTKEEVLLLYNTLYNTFYSAVCDASIQIICDSSTKIIY